MLKKIRFLTAALFSGLILISCVKKTSRKDTEDGLKNAMGMYLNHSPKIDTSRVKFDVLEVSYFEEKEYYVCHFKVNMKQERNNQLLDTTGLMTAHISKDLKNVSRTY
jgi:hypothetical protein